MGVKEGRDEKGRWKKGHVAIPNWNSEVNRLRKLLYTSLTNKKAEAIWDKMIKMAIDGDKGACELIMNYAGMKFKEEVKEAVAATPLFERIEN